MSDWTIARRVAHETRGYWGRFTAVVFVGLLETPLALLAPVPMAIVVDNVLGSKPPPALLPPWIASSSSNRLLFACVLLVAVAALSSLQSTAGAVLKVATGEALTLRFQAKLLANAQRQSFAFHDKRGTADAIYRIQKDGSSIQNLLLSGFLPVMTATITFISMMYVITRIDAQLVLVALIIAPILFGSAHLYKIRMRPRYIETKQLESSAAQVIQEVLTSFRVVKAFGREGEEEERFRAHSQKGLQARVRLALAENAYGIAVSLTTAVGTAVVLYVGVQSVQSGTLTLGELLIIVGYVSQLYGPLKSISTNLASLQNQFASADRAFQLLDSVPDVQERPSARSVGRVSGRISYQHVTFGYEPGQTVLRDVSIEIPAGARLGIAGRTGAGKTTLVSLLARFYDPDEGQILLDGVDLRDYKIADLRSQFAIVLQDPLLFATTIAENIAYAKPDAAIDEIVAAALAADAHDFIRQLPDGYDTVVGERGMRLSGGERQRISIARAFLKNAPILVFDEPTSSVDTTTELAIMETMKRLMRGRTTLMIAHRLSTLRECDALLEVEDGRVIVRLPDVAAAHPSNGRTEILDLVHARSVVGATLREAPAKSSAPAPLTLDDPVRAWGRVSESSIASSDVSVVRPKRWTEPGRHLYVFKLDGAGEAGASVAAILCHPERAEWERRVFEEWLPRLGVSSARYYGSTRDPDRSMIWQFTEFVEPGSFCADDPSHRELLAEWLGAFHAASRAACSEWQLPDRGYAFHREQNRSARQNIRLGLFEPGYISPTERELFESAESRLRALEVRCDREADAVGALPHSLIHGDLKAKNLGRRSSDASGSLLVLDWEFAGWAPVAVDMGATRLQGRELEIYAEALRPSLPSLRLADVERMSKIGEVFRAIVSIRWLTDAIPMKPAQAIGDAVGRHLSALDALLEELQW
jgi:ATP-binding cassette subfamily B protein